MGRPKRKLETELEAVSPSANLKKKKVAKDGPKLAPKQRTPKGKQKLKPKIYDPTEQTEGKKQGNNSGDETFSNIRNNEDESMNMSPEDQVDLNANGEDEFDDFNPNENAPNGGDVTSDSVGLAVQPRPNPNDNYDESSDESEVEEQVASHPMNSNDNHTHNDRQSRASEGSEITFRTRTNKYDGLRDDPEFNEFIDGMVDCRIKMREDQE